MALHNELGKWGEQVAREYLITHGYTIIEQDTRKGHFEVDIIAVKDNRIIFTEVKTRSAPGFDPLDAITPQKIRAICRAANAFVRRYEFPHEVEFDVIAVTGSPETGAEIEHIPDAFSRRSEAGNNRRRLSLPCGGAGRARVPSAGPPSREEY